MAREDERRFALRVLEGVLGGTSSSRLFQEVRERRGLAYSVFSFSSLHAHTGEVGLYVGTRPENLDEAMGTIAAELERFVQDPASAEELDRSRENLKGRMVLALESTGARMSRLGVSVLNEMPILSVDEVIERIDAVGIEDVRELAGELFAPERLSVAGVGPDEEALPRGDGAAGGWSRRLRRDARPARLIRVAVAGAAGRMGETVCAAVEARRGHGARRARRSGARRGRSRTCSPTPTSWWTSPSPTPRSPTRSRASGGRARGDRHDRLRPRRAA